MKYMLFFLTLLVWTPPTRAISDSDIQKHFERLDLEVVSMGPTIELRPKMCYQKRAVEIYDLIRQLFILTAVFFLMYMAIRLFWGQKMNWAKNIFFIATALGGIEVFPDILFLLTDRDFRTETCSSIAVDKATLIREFDSNEKIKEAMKKHDAWSKIEEKKPTAESLWLRGNVPDAGTN